MNPLIKKPSYSPIGLDIGSSMFKLLQLRQHRGSILVSKDYLGRIPDNTFENGLPAKPDLLAEKISDVVKTRGFQGRNVNISLNPQSFYFRTVSLPHLSKAELKKAMFWEAAHSFPIAENQLLIDFCPANNVTGNLQDNREYILAATSISTANTYTGIAEKAGLSCSALEIEPLSLSRSLKHSLEVQQKSGNSPLILIHMGYSSTLVLVIGDSRLLFYRSIKTGAHSFLKALQDIHTCSIREAEKILFNRKSPVDKKLVTIAQQLAVKIGQSLEIWFDESDHPTKDLQKIYFCGGSAFVPTLAAELESYFRIKGSLYLPLAGASCINHKDTSLNRRRCFFPVALGLALRGWTT